VVGPDGAVYFASAGGVIYSLDLNGSLRWEFRTRDRFYAAPTLGSDGRLYVGGLTGDVFCITAQGQLVWKNAAGGLTDRRIVAPLAVDSQGRSFAVAWDDQVYGFDRNGNLLWTGRAGGQPSAPLILDSRGFLYLSALSPQDPSRLLLQRMVPGWLQVLWRSSHPLWIDRNRVTAAPVLDEARGRLYAAASRDSDGVVVEVESRTGRIVREHWFPKGLLAAPALGPGGILLVPCLDGALYALDPPHGSVEWVFRTQAPYLAASPQVTTGGEILLADTDGNVYAIDLEGNQRWVFPGEGAVWSRPVPAPDGTVLVASAAGRVQSLGQGESFVFPHFGNGTHQGVRLQTGFEFVNLGQDAELVIDFMDPSGAATAVSLGATPAASRHRHLLPRGRVWTAETSGEGPLVTGWVRVTAGPGIRGTAVFRYAEDRRTLSESGVPAAGGLKAFSFPGQRTGPLSGTGVAIVNPGEEPAEVELTFRPVDPPVPGATFHRRLELPEGNLTAQYLWEIFPALGRVWPLRGLVQVQADHPVAAIAMRQKVDPGTPYPGSVPTLTTAPVIPADPKTSPGETHLLFPQTVRGSAGGLSVVTELTLVNPSPGVEVSGQLEFFTPEGQRDWLELEPLGAGSAFPFRLPPAAVALVQTQRQGDLRVGYARVSGDDSLSGIAVLQGRVGDTLVYEAGLPEAAVYSDFTVLVSESGLTGLAMVNAGSGPAQVLLRLYDAEFRLRASRQLGGPAGGFPSGRQVAQFLPELFPEAGEISGGILTVHSDQPLAAVTLVQHGDPRSFPSEVYRLTVYPVVSGRPD
jgi:outer membrane protein assembly factor BamB